MFLRGRKLNGGGLGREIFFLLFIAAFIVSAYLSSFNGVFIFDDYAAILNNRNVVGPAPALSGHRWLVDLTFRLNRIVSGDDVQGYHLFNLLVHLVTAFAFFGLVRHAAEAVNPGRQTGAGSCWTAAAAAVIWGVHPLNTQSVTYICQRYESMMGMFLVLSVYCLAAGLRAGNQRVWLNLSLLMLFLGMGCKEVMAVAPFLMLAYDFVFSGQSMAETVRRRGLFHIASFLMLMVLFFYQMQLAADQITGANQGARLGTLGAFSYLYQEARVIMHYIRLSLLPYDFCLDYNWRPAGIGIEGILSALLHSAGVLVSLAGLACRRWWGYAGTVFYAVLAPTSSILPVADMAAEHRMYIPLMPLAVTVAAAARRASGRVSQSRVVSRNFVFSVMVVSVSGGLAFLTACRNLDYWSEARMWQDVVRNRPGNLRARNDLAAALSQEGKVEQALIEYNEVVSRIPEGSRCEMEMGGRIVTGRFLRDSEEYVYFVAKANMGTMYAAVTGDYSMALECYLAALKVAPFSPEVRMKAIQILSIIEGPCDDSERRLDDRIWESIVASRSVQ